MKKTRVLIADDHKMFREGLRFLVDGHPEMKVVGEAAHGREVLACVDTLQPDVVLLDLAMPELNGLQTTELLRAKNPQVKVIALTAHEDETYLRQLIKVGALGYVLKRSAGDELINAILTVVKGGVHYEPSLAGKALARQLSGAAPRPDTPKGDLSDREREVLVLVAWGHSNKEIAAELSLSVKTVETYKQRIGEKLGLRSRTEMVQFALRQGWLNDSQPPLPPSA